MLKKYALPALKTLAVLTVGGSLLWGSVALFPSHSQAPAGVEMEVESLPLSAQVTVAGQTILLEVATTPAEQAQGLMFRPELAADRGMLFQFPEARIVRFWMKNTLIPLDMIFLRDGKIKSIIADVPPCQADPCPTYGPRTKEVNQVLELGAGQAQKLGLELGQFLEFNQL